MYNFSSLKPQIEAALANRLPQGEPNGFTLIDGFVLQSVQEQSTGVYIGGKSITTVLVVGNTTGRVYQFALKALLPNI